MNKYIQQLVESLINEARVQRTIDKKIWLTVSSTISKNRSTEAEFIKPMKKLTKDDLLQRYVAALLITKKQCPKNINDIEKLKTFKLFAQKALELGATINDIQTLYNLNNGSSTITPVSQNNIIKPVKQSRTKQYIIDTIKKYGADDYYTIKLPNDDRVSNNWNAEITGVYYNNKKNILFIEVYVQGDSTDEDTCVYFDQFVRPGTFTGTTDLHNFRFRFDNDTKQKALDNIYNYMDKLNNGLGDKIKNKKQMNEYCFDYRIINPIVDSYYERYNLKWASTSRPGTRTYDAYTAYHKAEDILRQYIRDNLETLSQKSKEELKKIYSEIYSEAFKENFNR